MPQPYSFAPVVLGSNQALSGTGLADIPGLTQNVAAGATYRFAAFLNYTTVGTSVTVGFTMAGTLSASASAYQIQIQFSAAGGNTNQAYTALPGPATQTGAITVAGTYTVFIRGFVTVSAGGTLTIQGIRGGSTSATILAGSVYLLEQVA